MIKLGLTALTPIAPILVFFFGAPPLPVFIAGVIGIAVLASWIGTASDQLARHTGPTVGGLITISLGSLAELVLGFFVLLTGKHSVVHAQIVGSIMATGLLGLGAAVLAGGIGRDDQHFKRERASQLASMLVLTVVALLLPAAAEAFRLGGASTKPSGGVLDLSLVVAIVLLVLYAANLIYTLVTHRDVFKSKEEAEKADWSLFLCLGVLAAATVGAAVLSDEVSGQLQKTASALGISITFLGAVLLALVGTISDIFAAVNFARQDRLGLVMSICIGSSIQVALVIAPLLVILSWLIGNPLSLEFDSPLELFSIATTALVVNSIAGDGETTWFEGVLLIGVYVLLASAFYFA